MNEEKQFNEPETIVNRLRGIYDTGPSHDPCEFRREFPDRPPINHEAARRIEALEAENKRLRDRLDSDFGRYVDVLGECELVGNTEQEIKWIRLYEATGALMRAQKEGEES